MKTPKQQLEIAIQAIELQIGRIKSKSSIHITKAWGKTDQADFANAALEVETSLTPEEALRLCLSIEKEMGRIRKEKWGPRIIDIDIIFYNSEIISLENPSLQIPHTYAHEREFVLQPLVEIAPNYIHPVLLLSVQELHLLLFNK
jgi:2-amino-4-hydroxy-6-hydroxymethyldihydropteridine diphosphokinase